MGKQRVAVIGASGYGGLQTLRLLNVHSAFEVTFLGVSVQRDGPGANSVRSYPCNRTLSLRVLIRSHRGSGRFRRVEPPQWAGKWPRPPLLERGVRVVDLSADYRYRSLEQWASVYVHEARTHKRVDADLCQEAVYGLAEWHGDAIAKARLVAARLFPHHQPLPLLPFLKQGLIETEGLIIDAKTGTSGGGRAAKENLLLAEASESIAPYGVVGHRHTSEIEQLASAVAGCPIQLLHAAPRSHGAGAVVHGVCTPARSRPDRGRLHHGAGDRLPQSSLCACAAGGDLSSHEMGQAHQPSTDCRFKWMDARGSWC